MAEILVRNLDDRVVELLKKHAKQQGRSLQAEVKRILEHAANEPQADPELARQLINDLRRRFKGRVFPDSVDLIREDRDR